MKHAGWVGGIALLVIMLPAWAVKSASQQSRITWVGFVVLMAFVGAIGAAAQIPQTRIVLGPYVQRNFWYLAAFVGTSFLIAGAFSACITYAQPGVGLVGKLGMALSQNAAILIPVVAKYATNINPPLSPETLFKTQSIVSLFMLAGVLSIAAYAIYLRSMPRAERLEIYASSGLPRHSVLFLCFSTAFAVYVVIAAYVGIDEFEAPEAKWWCAMQASCYATGDDLTIFAAALLKVLALLFPLGAALLIDSSRILPRES